MNLMVSTTSSQKSFWRWFFPQKTLDFQYPFSFLTRTAKVMPVFVWLAVILPFALSVFFNILIATITVFASHKSTFQTIYAFCELALVIAAFFIIYAWTKDKMIICGALAFFLFTILPTIGSIILVFILSFTGISTQELNSNTFTILITAIFDLIAGVLVIFMVPYIRKLIITTLQKRWKHLLVFVPAMIIIGVFLSYVFSAFGSFLNNNTSNNQSTLNITHKSSIGLIILVAVTTILIAPFIEECATRHSFYYLIGNKYLAFIVTFIYFAGMHVAGTFDWEHLFAYLGGSLILTSTFYLARGNVTYSWLTHAGLNTVTFVIMIAS